MAPMEIATLGAGQEVGKSCIVANLGGKKIMFDCGVHMGYSDLRMFPDFSCLHSLSNSSSGLDCIIISHFHLDHCGALPYFTEVVGFDGPIFVTYPTQAVLPLILEDSSRIIARRGTDGGYYTSKDIEQCMRKIVPIHMNEQYEVSPGFTITPYYAGHVIGAAMFYVSVNGVNILYTGDYNTAADRLLSAASIPCLRPDLIITESTYGGVLHECLRSKERKFLQLIHACIKRNGTVLIPIFALGRAQELCMLIETYWERMGWRIPVYVAGLFTERVTEIYKRFLSYTNESARSQMGEHNIFEFRCIHPYEKNVELNGASVIFSTPAMLHSGNSLRIFKNLCDDPKNLVILPGYCVRGTVGDKILRGVKELNILGENKQISLQVESLAFSAHADTLGIRSIIRQCEPYNIMLVHGDKCRMMKLKEELEDKFNVPVYMPPNGSITRIDATKPLALKVPKKMAQKEIGGFESRRDVFTRINPKKWYEDLCVFDTQSYFEEDNESD